MANSVSNFKQVSTDQVNLDLVAGQTFSTKSGTSCAIECVNSDSGCLGFLYDRRDESCVLLSCVNLDLSTDSSGNPEINVYVEDGLSSSHLLARGCDM